MNIIGLNNTEIIIVSENVLIRDRSLTFFFKVSYFPRVSFQLAAPTYKNNNQLVINFNLCTLSMNRLLYNIVPYISNFVCVRV